MNQPLSPSVTAVRGTTPARLYQHRCTECGLTAIGAMLPAEHHPNAVKEAVPIENPSKESSP